MLLYGLQKVFNDSIFILGRRKFGEVFGDGHNELTLTVSRLHPKFVDLLVGFESI